jgi:HSP20 family protein
MKNYNVYRVFDRDEFIAPFDKLVDKMFANTFPELSKEVGVDVFQSASYPKCDIIDYDDKMELVFEIPGLSKEQVSIDIDGDTLSISGNKHKQVEREGGKFLRRELKKSSFKRTFGVDSKVFDLDSVRATFTDGVLELVLPKHTRVQPTKKSVEIL